LDKNKLSLNLYENKKYKIKVKFKNLINKIKFSKFKINNWKKVKKNKISLNKKAKFN